MAKQKKDTGALLLHFIKEHPLSSSKEINDRLESNFAYATIKRTLQHLIAENLVTSIGRGKATKYKLSEAYELIRLVDVETYFKKEIDEREIKNSFNHTLIKETLPKVALITNEELKHLTTLQNQYKEN